MDEILAKYRQLRADLDAPVTVRADVAQAFREVYDAAEAQRLVVREIAVAALLRLMGDLSEEHWSAGWLTHTEFSLWEACEVGGSYVWSFLALGDDVVEQLRRLRDLAGGWWTWPHDADAMVFMSLPEMEQKYGHWKRVREKGA